MTPSPIRDSPDGAILTIHVQPGAARTEYAGPHGDALKFRVAAPPVDGAANDLLCRSLAARLGVPKSGVIIQAGGAARRKRVLVRGMTAVRARKIFSLAILLVAALSLVACAGPRPILYPNAHFQSVGKEQADQDIAECRQLAKDAGAKPGGSKAGEVAGNTAVGAGVGAAAGAAGGAVFGHAGRGAAVGAVGGATGGFLRGLFRGKAPSQAHVNFVNRCLKERGYEPVGWE